MEFYQGDPPRASGSAAELRTAAANKARMTEQKKTQVKVKVMRPVRPSTLPSVFSPRKTQRLPSGGRNTQIFYSFIRCPCVKLFI